MGNSLVGKIAGILVIVGSLNWGLVGIGEFLGRELNVVAMILGSWPQVVSVVYILVGLSALVKIFDKN